MTSAITGVGAEFQLGDAASPEVFTKVAEVISISGPELSAEQVEVTSLDSTGGYKEFIPGLLDGGSVTIEFNYVDGNTQQEALRTRVSTASQTALNYRIQLPDSPLSYVTFAATVESYSMNVETGSAVTVSCGVKISGAPVWS
jgi:predicted secreted protein